MTTIDGRTRHYGDFYRLAPRADDDRPLLLVWGNCQAEALRILLSSDTAADVRTVRVPPVHELDRTDLPHVHSLAREASMFVSQPVRSGYRGLPIGTEDLRALLPQGARTVRWPIVRYTGLHPFQIIVRHPSRPSAVPDLVPYHDVRTVLAVRDGLGPDDEWDRPVVAERLVAAALSSIDELRRRESRDADIAVSDLVLDAGSRAAHTINHPGNVVLTALAERILAALGVRAGVNPPDRDLLGGVRAPVEQRVLDALRLTGATRDHWTVNGTQVDPDDVHRAHLLWYARYPEFVDAAVTRHEERMRTLGAIL